MNSDHGAELEELIHEADRITELFRAIRVILNQPINTTIVESGLTTPQVNLLRVLAGSDGLSLKELSKRMGLAHSTVSGIVDRLEKGDLVARKADESDKRFTRVYLTRQVTGFLEHSADLHYPARLVDSLRRATPEERKAILGGLAILNQLLNAGDDSQPSDLR